MAKKESSKTETKISSMKDIFAAVDALNPEASMLNDENSLSIVNEWFDTGSFALNAIISGSLYKGIPRGRIVGFQGPSQAGKSLIINKIMANAQKVGYFAAIWDSEVAIDRGFAEGVGMDTSRTKYYPVETVEDCRNQISTFLDKLILTNDPSIKVIIAIDSLGNLASSKEIKDAQEGKDAMDMGTRAKALKSMMRALTYKAAKARATILFTNHIYDNPGEMHPSLVKTASGGKGPGYLASILIQLALRNEKIEKNEDEEAVAIAHSVSGTTISALTVKNRFAPPYCKTELYNNYRTGLSKYAGLYDIALAFGVITEDGHSYCFNGEKISRSRNWLKDAPTIWEEKIMPALEEVLKVKMCYSNTVTEILEGVGVEEPTEDEEGSEETT